MEQVLELLSELGGTATVRQMVDHARKKSLGKDLTHSIKVRDSLIRLKRRGAVTGNAASSNYADEVWALAK